MNRWNTKLAFWALAVSVVFVSCKASLSEANKNYDLHQYAVAADMYEQVLKDGELTKEQKQEIAFKAGEAYRHNHNSKRALKMYAKAIKYGRKDALAVLREAEMYMEQGLYTEALTKLKAFKKANPGDASVDKRIAGCELALKCGDKKTRYIIENFKVANESKVDDMVARYADRKHKSIMFTSDREDGISNKQLKWTGRSFGDFWITELKGRRGRLKWTAPTLVDGFTEYFDGAATFDARYSTMYFTQCNGIDGKDTTCKIYQAKKRGAAWEVNPEPLPFCSDEYDCGHPALSPDGTKLYFVSDMEGSYQDDGLEPRERTTDLYVVNYVRRGKTWSEPINLGPTVNTTGDEKFPFVHEDGTLYFSSDGHVSLGGLDILHTTQLSESPTDWDDPENMGCPVNSKGDDFGIMLDSDKEHGFFTSDRGRGDDDIYEFSMTPIILVLKGTVTDCDNTLPLEKALVEISNDQDSTKIRLYTDARGYYETPLKLGVNYEIKVSKREDYFYDAKPKTVSTVGLEQSAEFIKDFCLKNQCNDVFVLPIYYGLDSAFLRPESKRVLDGLISTLKQYPKMSVELGSHTDCRAPYQYNRDLSQRRADSAVAYILKSGINPFRLEARGYGESQLTNECECEGAEIVPCTEEQHQENRRTTVKVVNCKYEFKWSNPEVQDTNNIALGDSIIYSKVIIQARKDYIKNHGSEYEKEAKRIAEEKKRQEEEAERLRLEKLYDIIPVVNNRDKTYLTGSAGRKRLKLLYDADGSRVEIPQNTVELLLKSGTISVSDFSDGNKKIKLSDGTKLTSTSFKLKELKLDGVTLNKVRCKMVDIGKPAKIGEGVFMKDYIKAEIKDGKLYLSKEQE
ncbi:MAG: PD40 domain-containing protein [Bacteroidia bacterium]|nr:PD40 domain-containing protein [Bacteroidia bacterium]